jgi:GNAT superfamily N-acetyltransferase
MKNVIFALICIFLINLCGEDLLVNNSGENEITVMSSNSQSTRLRYEINALESSIIEIAGAEYRILHLEDETSLQIKGEPELPVLRRGIMIDGGSRMSVNILRAEYQEFDLAVAPSKGKVSINDNYNEIPYTFGELYNEDSFYPGDIAGLSEPYILRDFRGINLQINPVQYNPVSGKVRVYCSLEVEVYAEGAGIVNVLNSQPEHIVKEFGKVYERHFVNYQEYLRNERYPEVGEVPGKILVVCYDDFMEAMTPYVNWKKQKGIVTEIVAISDIGTSSTQLLNYLVTTYEEDDELTWVLLVGDAQQIPVIYNYGTYAGDVYFAEVAGTDSYPDIMVGRFSAESIADVETQVERTIYYERDIIDGDWMQKAAGCAYNGGPAGQHYEGGWEHMGYIRDDLLEYGYLQVDEIYEGQGASTQVLADAINEGRGVINYLGHGEDQNYYSIPFYENDVYSLENVGMLPFISNGACLIGNFAPMTCFAEYWLRATDDNGNAIGAIGFLASSISQWIGDPEYGQDEFVDLLCAEEKQTIGGLWYNCINYAMEMTTEWDEFACWNLFGDPNVMLRSKIPQEIELSHMPAIFMGLPTFEIEAEEAEILVCISRDNEIIASGFTDAEGIVELDISSAPQVPGILTITATGFNKATFIEEIQMIPPEGAYIYMDDCELESGLDDVLHAGETAYLDINLTNYGTDQATDVQLEMFLDDEWIEVLDNTESIGDMLPQDNVLIEQALCFQVSEDIEFAHPFSAELVFTSEENTWSFELWFSSYAPNGLWMSPMEIRYEIVEGDSAFYDLVISNYLEESVEISIRLEAEEERNINGSTVVCNTDAFLPGGNVNLVFTATNQSIDNEWISDIELDFPEEVDVLSVTPFVGASGGDMETESELGIGADVYWLGISPNGFGYLRGGETASSQVDAEVDYADLDSLVIDWRMNGDGYGADPHEASGSIDIFNPLSWIYLHDIHDMIPAGSFSVIEMEFDSRRLTPGEYFCEIVVTDDRLESRVPVLLTVIPQSEEKPDEITITNSFIAYPNPFNPSINISYNLPKAGFVELSVYNLKGQKIDTLCDGYQASGEQHYVWNAFEMPSGIYFLKIKGADIAKTEKVLLLK